MPCISVLSPHKQFLRVQVLGDGELCAPLTIRAIAFSASARDKIEAAGGKAVQVPQKAKWNRQVAAAAAAASK